MNRGRVGEERGSKEMDGCPLTYLAQKLQYEYYQLLPDNP
jgi:hypothetical protein